MVKNRGLWVGVAVGVVASALTLFLVGSVFAQGPGTGSSPQATPGAGQGVRPGPGGPGNGPGFGRGRGPDMRGASVMDSAVKVLGLDRSAIQAELQSGKTLAEIATENGSTAQAIIDDVVATQKAQLDQAVTDGKLTQAQADAMLADLTQRATDQVNGTWTPGPGGPGNGPGFGRGRGPDMHGASVMDSAVKVLGLDRSAIQAELQSGKTLAEIATENGKTAQAIIDDVVATQKAQLDQAVANGKLTQAQADAMLADLTQRATDQVNGVKPFAPQGPGDRPGFGPGGGPGMHGASVMDSAVKVLGLDRSAIQAELQAGKTLAEIATENGKTGQAIIDDVVAIQKAQLDQAITDGKLTQAQADAMLANLTQRATDQVNGVEPAGRPGNPGRGPYRLPSNGQNS